jgi:hypothetical protein
VWKQRLELQSESPMLDCSDVSVSFIQFFSHPKTPLFKNIIDARNVKPAAAMRVSSSSFTLKRHMMYCSLQRSAECGKDRKT